MWSGGSAHHVDPLHLLESDAAVMSSSAPQFQKQQDRITSWEPLKHNNDLDMRLTTTNGTQTGPSLPGVSHLLSVTDTAALGNQGNMCETRDLAAQKYPAEKAIRHQIT